MNPGNLRQLAYIIERLEHDNNVNRSKANGFSMDYLDYNCGTPSCIAGWACAMQLGVSKIPHGTNIEHNAAVCLDMSYPWLRDNLFYPVGLLCWPDGEENEPDCRTFGEVTPQRAARVLRTVADAGENYKSLDMRKVWSA